jgi:hypothetical protein
MPESDMSSHCDWPCGGFNQQVWEQLKESRARDDQSHGCGSKMKRSKRGGLPSVRLRIRPFVHDKRWPSEARPHYTRLILERICFWPFQIGRAMEDGPRSTFSLTLECRVITIGWLFADALRLVVRSATKDRSSNDQDMERANEISVS